MPRSSVGVTEGSALEIGSQSIDEGFDQFRGPGNVGNSISAGLGTIAYGQGITGHNRILDRAFFHLAKANSPPGNVAVKVYAWTGLWGSSGTGTGSALATSNSILASSLPTTSGWVEFTFSGANRIVLVEGTHYALVVEYNDGDATNFINVNSSFSQPSFVHPGNSTSYTAAMVWSANVRDVLFRAYGPSVAGLHFARWQKDSRLETPPRRYCITLTFGTFTSWVMDMPSGGGGAWVHRIKIVRYYIAAITASPEPIRVRRNSGGTTGGTTIAAADIPKLDTGAANAAMIVKHGTLTPNSLGAQTLDRLNADPTISAGGGAGPDQFDSGGDMARAIYIPANGGLYFDDPLTASTDTDARFLWTAEWEEE